MAGITLAQAQTQLDAYLTASQKIAAGQKVEIDGQSLTRANLAEVQQSIDYWDSKVKTLSAQAAGHRRNRTVAARW